MSLEKEEEYCVDPISFMKVLYALLSDGILYS